MILDVLDLPVFARVFKSGWQAAQIPDEKIEALAIDIAREMYDRFVMGGWEPQDAHAQLQEMLREGLGGQER